MGWNEIQENLAYLFKNPLKNGGCSQWWMETNSGPSSRPGANVACSVMPSPIQVTTISPLTSSLSTFLSQLAGYVVTSLLLGHRLLQDRHRVPILQTLETSCNALHELKRMPMGTYIRISACRPRDTNYEKRQQQDGLGRKGRLVFTQFLFSPALFSVLVLSCVLGTQIELLNR